MNAVRMEKRSLVASTLYGVSLAVNSALLSFLALLLTAEIVKGEAAEGLGLMWFFGLPFLVLVAIVGQLTFGFFLGRRTWWGRTAVYLGTVTGAMIIAYGGVWMLSEVLYGR